MAGRGPVASPARADGRGCAAGVWVTLPGRAFAVGRLRAVVPVPRPWSKIRCPSHTAARVARPRLGRTYHSRSPHPPARLRPEVSVPQPSESAPGQSPVWFGIRPLRGRPPSGGAPYPDTTPQAGTVAMQRADSNSRCLPTNSLPPGSCHACRSDRNIAWLPNRMLTLLRKASVIYDPRHYGAILLHRLQHRPPHLRQHLLVIPWRIRHQMVQRLVHTPNIVRGQACGHRFDALALPG